MEETTAGKPRFVWPCWWGGAAQGENPPLIHQKIQELRREIGGLEAKKAQFGPMFPVKSAKELEQKLQPALDKLGLTLACSYDVYNVTPADVPVTKNRKGEDQVVRSAATVKCTVKLCAEDGSFIESQGAGGGLDGDDKAVGKAPTYSRKDAILKMLAVPEKNMIDTDDESEVGVVVTNSSQSAHAARGDDFVDPREAALGQLIMAAETAKELKAVGVKARELPIEIQQKLAPLFTRQMAKVGG